MDTIYRKGEIKSERDLPKEDGRYYFHLKGNFDLTSCLIPSAKYNQIKKRIDWYLHPVEPQEERIPNVGKTIELREELISFARQFYADEETCIHNVDQYLTSKKP